MDFDGGPRGRRFHDIEDVLMGIIEAFRKLPDRVISRDLENRRTTKMSRRGDLQTELGGSRGMAQRVELIVDYLRG